MGRTMTGAELLKSGRRFSVTMWEYSWLVQRKGRQSEYADWDRVLDEVAERGYECIRIDVQPHCIARDAQGQLAEEVTFLPTVERFMWGSHEQVTVNPRHDLVTFMKKIKERGLYTGLSSWFNDEQQLRKLQIRTPEDLARVWLETLDFLDQEGLLDNVVWVDLCNEFPLWLPGVYLDILGQDLFDQMVERTKNAKTAEDLFIEWDDKAINRFNDYMTIPIRLLKAKYPQLNYTYSFIRLVTPNISRGDLSELDLLEPHIWLIDDLEWCKKTEFLATMNGQFPEAVLRHSRVVREMYQEEKEHFRAILAESTQYWAALARRYGVPLITTEAWSTVHYEDFTHNGFGGEWDWLKEVAEMGIREAIASGWQGICTSNFAEPHFEGMWYDVAWHQKMNRLVRGVEKE